MEVIMKPYTFRGITYFVSQDGAIYGPKGTPLKHRQNQDGYAVVTMGKSDQRGTQFVHRIVAGLFLPNPHGLPELDHLDTDRMNPVVENLEWVTHEENIRRAHERGNYNGRYVGEKNPKARLNAEIVMQLRSEYQSGTIVMELHKKYGYPYNTIGNAVRGKTWKHLPSADVV